MDKANDWPYVCFTVTDVEVTDYNKKLDSNNNNTCKISISYTVTENYEVNEITYISIENKTDSMRGVDYFYELTPYEQVGDVEYYYVDPSDHTNVIRTEPQGVAVICLIGFVFVGICTIYFIVFFIIKAIAKKH